MKLTVCR